MKPFWAYGKDVTQRALGWFWAPQGRSSFLVPSLYPDLSADEMTSMLNAKQRKHRKKRNQMARQSRRQNR